MTTTLTAILDKHEPLYIRPTKIPHYYNLVQFIPMYSHDRNENTASFLENSNHIQI